MGNNLNEGFHQISVLLEPLFLFTRSRRKMAPCALTTVNALHSKTYTVLIDETMLDVVCTLQALEKFSLSRPSTRDLRILFMEDASSWVSTSLSTYDSGLSDYGRRR